MTHIIVDQKLLIMCKLTAKEFSLFALTSWRTMDAEAAGPLTEKNKSFAGRKCTLPSAGN